MAGAQSSVLSSHSSLIGPDRPADAAERIAIVGLFGFAAALQLSIAAADILLAVMLLGWVVWLVRRKARPEVPPMFWPLAAYAALTLVASVFSENPVASVIDSRQLLLFLIVPAVYQIASGERAVRVIDVIITVGAASAIIGIVQYGILNFDNLGRRPQGSLGHYMTYSGLLMLVITAAAARLLFPLNDQSARGGPGRIWTFLVLPALVVALALTLTRSAWVGACAGLAVLFVLRDLRMLAVLPVIVALFVALAPSTVTDRVYSIFDLNDPSNRDRLAMMRSGARMIQDDPLTGVGPNMIESAYPRYRDATAVNENSPHLHNVPLQIAAERGLPALAAWLWFLAVVTRDLWRLWRRSAYPSLVGGALAALVSMLAAGFFEYNFGDSEFLMLLLVLVTLPFAAERQTEPARATAAAA
ncbi:MAG TPA: O-antigen ligase family protein [Vicinamibacterales bacterium]|nr:O-antigen ligase family protein [Vicinamibacterales bacterium]